MHNSFCFSVFDICSNGAVIETIPNNTVAQVERLFIQTSHSNTARFKAMLNLNTRA